MERPIADSVGREVPSGDPARLHDNCMLSRRAVAMAGDQFEEVSMNMDGVRHHRVIDEIDAHTLALGKWNRFVDIGHFLAIE